MLNFFLNFLKYKKEKIQQYDDNNRNWTINIRVTELEKECIKKLANCQKLDVSNFIRYLIFTKYLDDFIK